MAPSKYFYFLFFMFLISSLQIQARESQYFSKFSGYNNIQDQEPSFTPETHNGYGLYGHGSKQFPPTTTTTTSEARYTSKYLPSKTTTDEYTGGSYKEFNTGYYNNNNYNNNNYKNSYETEQQGTNDAKFLGTGYTTTYNKGYSTEKQGMSDTRFLENGKYYYHVNHENYYPNGYESERGSNEGFGTSRGVDSRNEFNNGGHYGNNENSYEFKNSVEEYQNQEEYVP